MSDPWWRRRKKKAPWLNDIYDELEKLGDLIDETMQKAFENSSKDESSGKSSFRGFSIRVGPDGKPKIREMNKNQALYDDADFEDDESEPLVDFIEEAETLVVLAQLPGITKDDIDLWVTETCLTLTVDAEDFEWYDELKLPTKVKPKSAKASYKNGVLEVKMEKSKKIDNKVSIK
ncbi:MAG: Hsp20/alpha crystallin family protein [Candidatus Bathyarchaeota archaeon]|nr:Hsp20/alpha crystallin family protein [Candidatus Bathyarchaeum tardum]WNZ28603.1 MAG: Hsp20/alpha crystallin family protein [Candidatus Bathyarchaeota archaeon]